MNEDDRTTAARNAVLDLIVKLAKQIDGSYPADAGKARDLAEAYAWIVEPSRGGPAA
ncbi:hypothetical protein ACHIPZ_12210 [Antrihabitans sp. NCIMB 15449]|uniref:Uncharacterized protein n=1 Tax=Antrihabitans spumae TaxID=3373370 RepID=A0ABW7JLT8_9NOCA